jgi:hypothetical protein
MGLKATGNCRKFYVAQLCGSCSSPNVIRIIMLKMMMGQAEHIEGM